MKKVEIAQDSAQVARIIKHSIEQPINILTQPAGRAKPTEPAHEGRSDWHRLHGRGMMALQIFRQHMPNQVHAGPAFFGQVAKNRDSERDGWLMRRRGGQVPLPPFALVADFFNTHSSQTYLSFCTSFRLMNS